MTRNSFWTWLEARVSSSSPLWVGTAYCWMETMSRCVRERDVTEAASRVSVHPKVREWMVARQREMGIQGGVVMEGRDIGTKVFPDADLKIFLDADPVVREQRRL